MPSRAFRYRVAFQFLRPAFRSRLAYLAVDLAVFPFGFLTVGGLVDVATSHPIHGVWVAIAIEAMMLSYLAGTRKGRAAFARVWLERLRRLRRLPLIGRRPLLAIGAPVALIVAVALWMFHVQSKTNAAERPAKQRLAALASAVSERLAGSTANVWSAGQLEAFLRSPRLGAHPTTGPAGANSVAFAIGGHGMQVLLVTETHAECIAVAVSPPLFLGPSIPSVPTNALAEYAYWSAPFAGCSASVPTKPPFPGATLPTWTSSRGRWMSGDY